MMRRWMWTQPATLFAGAALFACGPAVRSDSLALGSSGTPPSLVQAKCGSCHRRPDPHPLKDSEVLRRMHVERLHLSPEEVAEAFDWVQNGGGGPPEPPGSPSGSGRNW